MGPKAIAPWFGIPAIRMLPFLLCVISPCSFTVAADDGVALPRYRLEIGQELVYQRTLTMIRRRRMALTTRKARLPVVSWNGASSSFARTMTVPGACISERKSRLSIGMAS